jgi:L-alanine-DL-glutamate epimerase-like enolase superfamily enzyme
MGALPKVRLEEVACFERETDLRLPFRFGAATVTRATQVVVRIALALDDGRAGVGVAAETLAAKWFDKNPALSDAENRAQLRQALALAIRLYSAQGWSTPFGLFAATYRQQRDDGAELGLAPLVSGFGPALLDRAILDALGRLTGQSLAQMIAGNAPGIELRAELVPDLAGFDLDAFLRRLRPRASIAVRHTVGLLDPLTAEDQEPHERRGDGLPETLEEVVHGYGGRYYKLKLGGDIGGDVDRLTRIAAVLDRTSGRYRVTLDGNEQYESAAAVGELWRRMRERPALARLAAATLFIEQPIGRAAALTTSVAALARARPLLIDESDDALDAFPAAVARGYTGVSSKSCKGLYKSFLNAARIARLNALSGRTRPAYFMSAEDLTTLAGASVQQDLALAAQLGMTHVERNGHHFVDGMAFAPAAEQASFARAHPDLYRHAGGRTRLAIAGGRLRISSLACPGFAVAAAMDFAAMRPMRAAPRARITPGQSVGCGQPS